MGLNLIGRKVEVHYDPSWKDEIEVHYSGIKPFKTKELVIGEFCGSTRELPEHLKTIKPQTSRLIEGLNKANITNRTQREVAVVFRKIKEVAQDV